MPHLRTLLAVATLTLGAASVAPRAAGPFPPPQGYVSDFAGVLDASTRAGLEATLRDTERQTTAEIFVATVTSLDDTSIEEYAARLFKAWGIGKKGVDNGALILVAPTDRKMRIEVGYGLEPILPDGLAGDIIRTTFLPRFRDGDYAGGIRAGVARVNEVVLGNHHLSAAERREISARSDDRPPLILTTVFFGAFVTLGFIAVGAGLASKTIFPIIWGAMFGGIPLLMALIPAFNASPLLIVLLGAASFAFGYHRGRNPKWLAVIREGARHGGGSSGWAMGSSSGSGGGSSSGGGGGGGGGSSGGGGASGSW